MISVIVTTHNRKDKLKRAIESVFNQSFTKWELVIVDDCSTDGTDKLVHEYQMKNKDKEIQYIKLPQNFGTHTKPKNIGTKSAKYDLIAYLDDDNEYLKDHLQALYKAMQPNIDVVYGDRMLIDETGKKPTVPAERLDFSLHELSKRNYIDTSDVLCRKSAIEKIGGWDEGLKYFGDYNLWVRMAKNGARFERVPLIITNYYIHGDNNVTKSALKYEELIKNGMSPENPGFQDSLNGFSIQGCKIWPEKTSYGPAPKLKVAVFTMTYNRCKYTQETFSSMRETTEYPFDHFVLDQGSTDGTWRYLCDYEKKYGLKIYTENKNLGISAGSNYLLDKIGFDYDIIIKVDNDLRFISEKWLETIVEVFERTKGMVVSPYIEGLIDHPGGWPRVRDGYVDRHYVGVVQHLGGACIAAPLGIYKGFRWREDDFLHGEQDWIFSQEVMKSGRVLAYLENVRVEHMFNTSPSANPDDETDKEYLRNRKVEKVTRYEG
jgi:glycosyltransferase involved in cell wall biosynthesis